MMYPEVQPKTPGKYICWPAATQINYNASQLKFPSAVESEGMWIVDVVIKTLGDENPTDYLCYIHPTTEDLHTVESCDHKFYGPIPDDPRPFDEAIRELLDAHKALDRDRLAKSLNGLRILIGYSIKDAGLVKAD